MRKDVEREAGLLAMFLCDCFTERRIPSEEYAEGPSLSFTVKSAAATSSALANYKKIITLQRRNQENRQI